jgi:RHS repeat-associated protein
LGGRVALVALSSAALLVPLIPPHAARAQESTKVEESAKVDEQAAPHAAAPVSESAPKETGAAAHESPTRSPETATAANPAEDRSATSVSLSSAAAEKPPVAVDALPVGGDKTGVSSQAISVPQGTGKIQGMGESFSTQLSTGIANFSVPFALVPARGHVQPSLSLGYSSAGGHEVAGVGWGVGVAFIARQTDRGLPLYNDPPQGGGWQPTQDRFVFNGGQELIPICLPSGGTCSGTLPGEVMPIWANGWQYFRPRVEGSFLRFFWSPDHRTWRIQSKTGETMELGAPLDTSGDTSALETDPNNPQHIFRWNLARQYDAQGNANPASGLPAPVNIVVYRYLQDGGIAYPSDIYDTSLAANPTQAPVAAYAHHTRLVYETRPDTTFSYRRGWQTSQGQRLIGVDVTSFDDATGQRELVRRYHLAYDPTYHVSLLASVQMEGRCSSPVAEKSSGALPASTGCPTLPPMTLGYQHVVDASGNPLNADVPGWEGFDHTVHTMADSPSHSLDEALTDLFDVNSDGLPDVMMTAPYLYGGAGGNDALFINGKGASGAATVDSFGPAECVGVQGIPSEDTNVVRLDNPNVAALDIDGDGIVDLVHMPEVKSYSVYTPLSAPGGAAPPPPSDSGCWMWKGRPITTASEQNPKINFQQHNPNIKVMDVNGDGLVDVVFSSGTEYQTFFALGRYPNGDGQFGAATWTGASSAAISNDPVTYCLPWDATPPMLGDSDVRIADMNGDGLPDIVRVRPGDVRYWPGRGNGYWGTGDPTNCPGNTFDQAKDIVMTSSPQIGVVDSTESLRLDDVNGDGLDDIVKVEFTTVYIWLNVDGTSWAGPHIIQNAPPRAPAVDRVRLVDINGSGTRDILYGDANAYKYMDLSGGARPWVLTHVDNGLGKTTDVEYSTSTALMLAAAAAGQPWTSTAPMPIEVVVKSTERDHMDLVGRAPGVYVTEYSYSDPVYDGRQREFRGFRSAQTRRDGDLNSPSSTTTSTFLLGECTNDENAPIDPCSEQGRWEDNPREALKGLPLVSETFDDAGVYLSTGHHTYRLRKLYSGLDGREVRYAFESQGDLFSYDTAPFAPGTSTVTLTDVERETTLGSVTPDTTSGVTLRSSTGRAHLHKSSVVDVFGNATDAIDDGCVDGCLDRSGNPNRDDSITTHTTPGRRSDDPTGWMYRTVESFVAGAVAPDTRVHTLKHMLMAYDPAGNLTQTFAVVTGTLPLDRFNPSAGGTAPAPPGASSDSTPTTPTLMGTTSYDLFGNPTHQTAPNARCRDISYDPLYAELPIIEQVHVGPLAQVAGGCGPTPLTASATYDRGLHAVTQMTDLHGEVSTAAYDGFGRIVALTKPDPQNPTMSPPTNPATVKIAYFLPTNDAAQPFSRIHTLTQDGPDATTPSYHESWGFVDGLGRTIVALDQADPSCGDGGAWTVNGLTTYDAKGAAQRAYLAFFYGGSDGGSFPLGTTPPSAYASQRYDAFGRQLQTFGLDGTITLQSAYHAVSVDKFDAADILPGPHQGTPASARADGHGRTIALTERIHNGKGIESRETRTTFLPNGAPQVIARVRDNTTDAVVRWIRYDSLGRMVLNVEPNTTKAFTATPTTELDPPPPTGQSAAMHAWRYAYNDDGDLVGTSDARGCGANYHYDAGGRVVAEDFSPCETTQPNYSQPHLDTGNGTEAFYRYDQVSPTFDPELLQIQGCTINKEFLLGRLVAVKDRGAETATSYDGRGRATCVGRLIAVPVTPGESNDDLTSRYTPHWYTRTMTYDGADRPVTASTGADNDNPSVQQLLDANGQSVVTTAYCKRGTVKGVSSGYGPLVTGVVRDADGLVGSIVYGDIAQTTTAMSYDNRRRLSSVTTYRGPPAIWSKPLASYQPPPTPNGPPSTFQLLLEDVDYVYDNVDNPVEIRDFRNPAEWPAGAQPVTRKIQYDDLYRVTQVDYESAGGPDTWVSPFDAENQSVDGDPRRAKPSPHVTFSHRVLQQSFAYDWLGNTIQTDDDAHGFYDRSLGAITNGTTTGKPYQLQSASAGGGNGGSLTATTAGGGPGYDDAGNLIALSVTRVGPCLPATLGTSCSQRFTYDWDEVGRLVHARRFDGGATTTAAELVYAYDATDGRTLKTAIDPQGHQLHTAYVFASLELRRTTFGPVNEGGANTTDFVRSATTEVPYLFAHGVRLARVHFSESGVELAQTGGGGGGGNGGGGDGGVVGDAGPDAAHDAAADASTTITISGVVTNTQGGPIAGAMMQLLGSASKTTTTNASGQYAFPGLAHGSYTLSISLKSDAGSCVFALSSINLNNLTTSRTENFVGSGAGCGNAVGTPPPLVPISISGRVTNAAGVGLVGVTVNLLGSANGTELTDGVGNYGFSDLPPGSYSLFVTASGCNVANPNANFNNLTMDVIQNFTASGGGCVLGGTPDPVPSGNGGLHVLFELPDHLGSTSIVVDQATSEVVERETYTAFGGKDSDYRPQRWDSFREDYGFTGKEEDVEVGLQYFGKRYLNSALGRWTSADPLTVHGLGSDLNAYAYVHGRLLVAVDPIGLCGDDYTICAAPQLNAQAVPEKEGKPGTLGNPVDLDQVPGPPARAAVESAPSRSGRPDVQRVGDPILIHDNDRELYNSLIHLWNETVDTVVPNIRSHDPKWARVDAVSGISLSSELPSYLPPEDTPYWHSRDELNIDKTDTLVHTVEAGASVAAPIVAETVLAPAAAATVTGGAPAVAEDATFISSGTGMGGGGGRTSLLDVFQPTQTARRFDFAKVQRYADMMRLPEGTPGAWDWSLDKIIVDSEGNIMSGHHRILGAEVARLPGIPEGAIYRFGGQSGRPVYQWSDILRGSGLLGF